MKYFIIDKDTDDLVEIIEDISQFDIDKYEAENPDKYITDETNFNFDLSEDDIAQDLIFGEDDIW